MNSRILTVAVAATFLVSGIVIFFREPINQKAVAWRIWEDHNFPALQNKVLRDDGFNNSVNLDSLDIETLRFLLHGLLTSIEFDCKRTQRFGFDGNGGYDICISNVSVIKPNSCLVYSFGIDNNWSFDEAISSFFNCTVHAFDPSIGKPDHKHSTHIYFHNLGLGGNVSVSKQGWKMSNLGSIKQNLGHSKVPIDVLKVDAEGAEWPLFRELTTSELDVKQLIIEVHTPTENMKPMTKANYIDIILLMRRLRAAGYVLFRNYHRFSCCGGFAPLFPKELPEKCCHELSYVNINHFRQ